MKKILGLDLGTNSIGWALIEQDFENKKGRIIKAGTRIIPMSQDVLGKFDSGVSISQTAERTGYRGVRRLRERALMRRERLHRVLNILGFLPEHYASQIDFEKHYGQFKKETEPKIAYQFNAEIKKIEFLFKSSFQEMMLDFAQYQPELLENGKKIPYDWTIYYLRNKALSQKIEKHELAWLLLNFNQKRGYYQLRGEDEDTNPNKLVEFHSLEVAEVTADEKQKGKDEIWYNIILENGWVYRRASKIPLLDWKGKTKEFVVTTDLNDDGTVKTDKDGKEKRSFRAPAETDWTLIKTKTEQTIDKSGKTVGSYIYDTLLHNPKQKINGKLVQVIERKFYKSELMKILSNQKQFHPELQDKDLYAACLEELYEHNDSHKANISQKDFVHLFINDIIFYQRPLKSKKSEISDCKFEVRKYQKDGTIVEEPLKCIPKSHPLYQEFRLWQWIQNLKIYEKDTGKEVTSNILGNENDYVNLFEWLNDRKEVDQKALLGYLLKPLKLKASNYRWNYVYDEAKDESKAYPCNETRSQILNRLEKVGNVPVDFLAKQKEEELWHILYSVEDKIEVQKALKKYAEKNGFRDDFVEVFSKMPPYKKEYGSYSAKAIKKLLPLMRMGKYWNLQNIHPQTLERIDKILTGEYDESVQNRVREKAINLQNINDFQGLPLWLSSYVVYDRHSEDGNAKQWKTPSHIEAYLRDDFEQHEFRNPIVEQVIVETLRVVRDIWNTYGNGKEKFFDEIHIELGREIKNPADKRKEMTNRISENENTNLRIKALLTELLNDNEVENVRPYSPSQQEILRIYEDGVLNSGIEIEEEILKISKKAEPTKSELIRYKLWLEQKYKSPYTGKVIPLNKLFTTAYEIEHIIPQSRYFDDSFNNKVICEAAVNKDKDNKLAWEYISENGGKIIDLGFGETATIFTVENYEKFIKETYKNSKGKKDRLLMDDIPEKFVQRQLNDSRYISKAIKSLLSNIVREPQEQESISKHVITTNGTITSQLKQDWGLNDVWNDIITPRFIRLNELTKSSNFGEINPKTNKFLPKVPLELSKGFNKKRIDHRHHELDAIVIACTSREHVNYFNNESALGKAKKEEKLNKRYDLREILCYKKYNDGSDTNYKWVAKKPWETITENTRTELEKTVVSFKQNIRIINKTVNYYQKWLEKANKIVEKELVKQIKGENWAIRKPLHKDTVYGQVNLKFKKTVSLFVALENWELMVDKTLRNEIKDLVSHHYDKKMLQKFFKDRNNQWNGKDISKVEIFYYDNDYVASRVKIDETFNSAKIETITDSGIQHIMLNHLAKYNEIKEDKLIEHPELAFSAEGLDEMNKNIIELNNGKNHQPIFKVRTFEPKGNKFAVGTTGNKKDKFVVAAKGTNLFFAIYLNEAGKRLYETIPLNIVIERLKQGLSPVPEKNANQNSLLLYLSPDDLVYVPTPDENINTLDFGNLSKEQSNRVYKMVSATDYQCFFIRNDIATTIVNKYEYSPLNKMEKSIEGIMIKDHCIKLRIDRLGNISKA